jgi:hypothetical protein
MGSAQKRFLGHVVAISALCLLLGGCVQPSAVDDFAKVSAQAAQLFPAVAAIPYDGCVAREENAQIQQATSFNGDISFNHERFAASCAEEAKTKVRLVGTYAVLSEYIQTLAKLAGGSDPTYDKQVTGFAGAIPGLKKNEQAAASGLASVIVNAFAKHWRERQAAKAIEMAQPDVLVITALFEDEIPKFLNENLNSQRDSLISLYLDAYQRKEKGGIILTNPVLITRDFAEAEHAIEDKRAAVQAFEKIAAKIREGHTALYNDRNKLFARDSLEELLQVSSAMKTQVAAAQKALKH